MREGTKKPTIKTNFGHMTVDPAEWLRQKQPKGKI